MILDVQLIRHPICQRASDRCSPVGAVVHQQDDSVRFSGLPSEGVQAATDPLGFIPDRNGDNPCCSCCARRLVIRMHLPTLEVVQAPGSTSGGRLRLHSRLSSPTFDVGADPTHTSAPGRGTALTSAGKWSRHVLKGLSCCLDTEKSLAHCCPNHQSGGSDIASCYCPLTAVPINWPNRNGPVTPPNSVPSA